MESTNDSPTPKPQVKHSPGPWAWDGVSRIYSVPLRSLFTYKDGAGNHVEYMEGLVALPYGTANHAGTFAANARLIAAAPELLAFVTELSQAEQPTDVGDYIESAKALLATLNEGAAS